MELPEKIAGLDARKVREMFKAMMATETKIEWNDGAPSIELRRVTPELVETNVARRAEGRGASYPGGRPG